MHEVARKAFTLLHGEEIHPHVVNWNEEGVQRISSTSVEFEIAGISKKVPVVLMSLTYPVVASRCCHQLVGEKE